jgi:predicted Zn-dependent protease
MGTRMIKVLVACLLGFATASRAAAPEDAVLGAMQDELQRALGSLRIEGQPPPYYVAAQLDDTASRNLTARLGEISVDNTSRSRVLRVEVRVGDYAFDSSRFVSAGGSAADAVAAALDDDYDVIRRQLWLLADAAYKRAVNVFARKKAAFQNRNASDSLPDFSRATPVQRIVTPVLPATAWNDWIERIRQMSGVFLADPAILSSEVNLVEERGRRYYVNSEGFRIVIPTGTNALRVIADTQASDGMPVRDAFEISERSLSDMPAAAELLARTRQFAARLAAARAATVGDDYTGPVLFEGRGAGELVAQVLVPALLAVRAPDNERGSQGAQPQFLSRIGSRVMAEDLSVSDTPSLALFNGRPVPGAYELDDEGTPAQDVLLIDKGKLQTLLTNRVPQRNLPLSNGHGRGGAPQAGVVQMSSATAVPYAQLKESYLKLLKDQGRPFGYIVRSLAQPAALIGSVADINELLSLLTTAAAGPGAATGPLIPQIIKVTPDGAEQVVRGMRFGALSPNAFREVLGASQERELLNFRGTNSVATAPGTLGARQVPVSVIAPSLIVDDLEIQRTRDVAQKPPVVPSPLMR